MIGILHNKPAAAGSPFSVASLDVLEQVKAVEVALEELGYSHIRIPFTRDIGSLIQAIEDHRIEMVLNLCETLDEDPKFSGHAAAVLELLDIPFSGSPSVAIMLTTDKLTAKRLLEGLGIATPRYTVYEAGESFSLSGLRYPVIVKPRFEDASIGIDQDSIFGSEATLRKGVRDLLDRFGALLIEEYIEGREFNVSIMGYPSGIVLPVAEIDFSAFPKDLYLIVGYRAKWDKTSFEYHQTPRTFTREISPRLLSTIKETALRCFDLFMLRDYGRIDFRLNNRGDLYVLEVNANPCLSPDAGFASAAEKAGMAYSDLVNRLLSYTKQRSEKGARQIAGSGR